MSFVPDRHPCQQAVITTTPVGVPNALRLLQPVISVSVLPFGFDGAAVLCMNDIQFV